MEIGRRTVLGGMASASALPGLAAATAIRWRTLVLRVQPADVKWVFVDGAERKRAGKLVGVDLAQVRRQVTSSHAYLMGLMRQAGADIRRG